MFFYVVISTDDSLNEVELDLNDGDLCEVGDDGGDGTQQSWSSLTVAALKSALVERGLQTTGSKADLVARLEACKSGRLSVQFLM